jgi:hypothetical protein
MEKDELGFPLDSNIPIEQYESYTRQYEPVKEYIETEWEKLILNGQLPQRSPRGIYSDVVEIKNAQKSS